MAEVVSYGNTSRLSTVWKTLLQRSLPRDRVFHDEIATTRC